jgi:hypothetical protein
VAPEEQPVVNNIDSVENQALGTRDSVDLSSDTDTTAPSLSAPEEEVELLLFEEEDPDSNNANVSSEE